MEMSPVREESPLRAAVAVVGGAGYVRNVGGAGPVGYGENMGGAGPVGYGGNVGGVDGVGGRSFRGQGYGAVQGGGRRAGDGDGDGDGLEQPLLGHARNRECLAVYWRDSASLCELNRMAWLSQKHVVLCSKQNPTIKACSKLTTLIKEACSGSLDQPYGHACSIYIQVHMHSIWGKRTT